MISVMVGLSGIAKKLCLCIVQMQFFPQIFWVCLDECGVQYIKGP